MHFDPTAAGDELPDIEDRLVVPETGYEMHDGELVYVPPSDAPHGERQLQLCALLEAHTGAEFEAACELLTRTSKVDDVAPDASVYPAAPDPRTGRRQLEQLAFEVVSTETLAHAARKAAKLSGRGVRRVFAIDIERARALEWSAVRGGWRVLDPSGHIVDPALAVPLPIDTVIHSAKADDAIARALAAKRNPVIEAIRDEGKIEGRAEGKIEGRAEGKIEGRAEGKIEGRAEAVLTLLATRGVALGRAERARILAERDLSRLERWLVQAMSCATAAELFRER